MNFQLIKIMFGIKSVYNEAITGHIGGFGFILRMDFGVRFWEANNGAFYDNDGDACMTTGESSVDLFLLRKQRLSDKDMFVVVENLRKQIMAPFNNNPLLKEVLNIWTLAVHSTAASFEDSEMNTDHPSWLYDFIQAHEDSVVADFTDRVETMLNPDGSSSWKTVAKKLNKMYHYLQDAFMPRDKKRSVVELIEFINLDNMLTMVGVIIMRKASNFMYQKYSPLTSNTTHLNFIQTMTDAILGSVVKGQHDRVFHMQHVCSGDGDSKWVVEWHDDEYLIAVKDRINQQIQCMMDGTSMYFKPIFVF